MTVLKNIIRKAVSRRYLARNPFQNAQAELVDGLKPLKEPPGRVRYLSENEIEALLAACEHAKYIKQFALVALNSGMPRNEILSLSRQSIDWVNRIAPSRRHQKWRSAKRRPERDGLRGSQIASYPPRRPPLSPNPQSSKRRLPAGRTPRWNREF